jgi:drug/metabolite transporter (DMT)-like permease
VDVQKETVMQASREGWLSGLAGVVIFSGSLPATRIAVADLSPLFLTSARAVLAAVLAAALLLLLRQIKISLYSVQPCRLQVRGC